MPSAAKQPKTPSERMTEYRRRMRQRGLRQVQIWVPDLRNAVVLAEYQRQARAINDGSSADDEIWHAFLSAYEWPEYNWPQK